MTDQSKVIWKYELSPGRTTLHLPSDATILTVGVQGTETVVLWALLDYRDLWVERVFETVATGQRWAGEGRYIDTVMMNAFGLVFHIFEVTGV